LLNKYSTSLEVRLTIRQSRYRRLSLAAIGVASVLALVQLWLANYNLLALLLAPPAFALIYQQWSDPMVGAMLIWSRGEWSVCQHSKSRSAVLEPGAVNLSQLVYLSLREVHGKNRWNCFVFPDSADETQLHRLRRRLTLSG